MKKIQSMTSEQLHWLYMLNDDNHYHFDPWNHPTGLSSGWMDTFACRIADTADGYAKQKFNPAKTFTPDPKLLAMGYLNWSKNPSFPPKAWNQMAMSSGRSSMPFFKDYLQQSLDSKSFIIPRHEPCAYTFSNSATPSNLNKLINNITSKSNNYWVIFDHKEAQTVENTFKNNIFKNWCELIKNKTKNSNRGGHFTSGMWGTFPLFNFPTFGTDLFRALNDPVDGPQILAQGFLYAFYG